MEMYTNANYVGFVTNIGGSPLHIACYWAETL